MTLVDANVALDLVTRDPYWAEWSTAALDAASIQGPLLINDVIYAELSVRYENVDDLERFVNGTGLQMALIPRPALFLAGKAFARYRKAGGTRTGVLPDFFVGAHAMVSGIPLLTRDARRYRTYFPAVTLVSPQPQ